MFSYVLEFVLSFTSQSINCCYHIISMSDMFKLDMFRIKPVLDE